MKGIMKWTGIIGGVFLMRYSVVFIGFDIPLS